MDLPKQKNFYDIRRYFQGKDNPDDQHPEPKVREPMPRGQVLFGLIFLAFVGLLFWLRVHNPEAPAAKDILAAPAKH